MLAAELRVTPAELQRAYRDRLRAAAPGLRFVFLDISQTQALQRVAEGEANAIAAVA
mgnify:CR=1 FL=1